MGITGRGLFLLIVILLMSCWLSTKTSVSLLNLLPGVGDADLLEPLDSDWLVGILFWCLPKSSCD